jgi:hypothetical protein
MTDKIVNQLPVVLQTTAIKNFFENSVEQLYSKANVETLKGFIGKKTGEDFNVPGAFIMEPTADRREYNLSPVANNINPITGESENILFYDEFINILRTYNVDTSNHNLLFGSRYQVFMPPIDIDKFINYHEYYWVPTGPSKITISPSSASPINLELDVLGKSNFTSETGISLKNGMVVEFVGDYVIPSSMTNVEYIVEGVGDSILLVNKNLSTMTRYGSSSMSEKDYLIIGRGSKNGSAWSRVNHWYHIENFLDVGDPVPEKQYRANRPIIEFDRTLELYDHGTNYVGSVTVLVSNETISTVQGQSSFVADTRVLVNGDTLLFPNETDSARKLIYSVSGVGTAIVLTPVGNVLQEGDVINISSGLVYRGLELIFNNGSFSNAQDKIQINQPPLFVLYDDNKNRLDDAGLYPQSNFKGNKIFSYQVGTGKIDPELGFSLSYQASKSTSEIAFENFIQTDRVAYRSYGSNISQQIPGSYYYKILRTPVEYHSYWKSSDFRNDQLVTSTYEITRFDFDNQRTLFDIGTVPAIKVGAPSGYDIRVKVNNVLTTDYIVSQQSKIKFNSFTFKVGDLIDISVNSDTGISQENNVSRYSLPLSWRSNPHNDEIEIIAEPQFLPHFKQYIEEQNDFSGDPLGLNNFRDITKDISLAKDIVQTDQDLILAAFLIDDQPHNLIEAIRFNAKEYEKYRARLVNEISNFYNKNDISNLTTEQVLERVLRNMLSYRVGKNVFSETYVLPFGDNYIQQDLDVADVTDRTYTLTNYLDLNSIKNSLLVYYTDNIQSVYKLLTVDQDYVISNYSPITITIIGDISFSLGDTIVTKLYDGNRDSVECPPTPSTMGLYPLFLPRIKTDLSFQNPVTVLVGHDGSRTTTFGDVRDDILLEFEKRIYNAAKNEFRESNSLPLLNVTRIRPGAFRTDTLSTRNYFDLLNTAFANWTNTNKVDFKINEFYDFENKWTWNYRGDSDIPGHWRGWYEYHYDTVRPHTHPWEMLAFFEKPAWWDSEYGTDYGSTNTQLWGDLEQGIIRHGPRENFSNSYYLLDNTVSRPGLSEILPVDAAGNLLPPADITNTGSTNRTTVWDNQRVSNTDITDQFKDLTVNGTNSLPNGIGATYGSGEAIRVLWDQSNALLSGHYWDYDGSNSSYSVFTEGWDGFTTPFVYVTNDNIGKSFQLYNYGFEDLTISANVIVEDPTPISDNIIAITTAGVPVLNPKSSESWHDSTEWFYNNHYRQPDSVTGTFVITASDAGLTEWDTEAHSPIVGWSFDGLPIYGPYGYTSYHANGLVNNNTITNIKSAFRLKTGTRPTAPGGAYTGEFVRDYEYDSAVAGTPGYTGSAAHAGVAKYNIRYGVTPDSPSNPIYFYVVTLSDSGLPMFPYVIGGTENNSTTYQGQYFSEPVEQEKNNLGSITSQGEIVALRSSKSVLLSTNTQALRREWKFGDGAPVENAWKYNVGHPFAITEALLLAKPGRFVTVFSDPTNLVSPEAERFKLVSAIDRRPWDFRDPLDFRIHGDIDTTSREKIVNVGYTQFINTWLNFQGLNVKTDFADKLRTVNLKLGHRFAGFTDKDTLVVRSDQYSPTGESTSLVIPDENIELVIHSSPYKTNNFYSGIMIQKTARGYRIRGYNRNLSYFKGLRLNKSGATSLIEIAGEPAPYTAWKPNTDYTKDTIVSYQNSFYKAPAFVSGTATFVQSLWARLPSLPQLGGVRATAYLDTLPIVDRIDYETEFTTHQQVVEAILSIGYYQEQIGFDFGEFDNQINDVRNWAYSTRQFLFWVSGGWQNNNILELSPLAGKIKFNSTSGMIAKINRVDRSQFCLLDQDGIAIAPTECEIVRIANTIEIVPPVGKQIYAALLFTKEIEHAMVIDNITEFNDTIFDPVYNQKQTRLRVKGIKTANWTGGLSSEGFIIQGDQLKPNLDNMAQSLGRYHELGFIPVERQLYEVSRYLFGYQDRQYMRDLEIDDDDQFEFYVGMLRDKGTKSSLTKIAKSSAIVQGNMEVYDEWALKVGDFGDLENDQTIELKLEKSDVTQDPQLITLAFPEDTTGVVNEIRVLKTKHRYYAAPVVEISAPTGQPADQATAIATLAANGVIAGFTVTNRGSGYIEPVRIQVIAGDLTVSNVNTTFNTPVAQSEYYLSEDVTSLNLTNFIVTDNTVPVTANISLASATTVPDVANLLNSGLSNTTISVTAVRNETILAGSIVYQYVLKVIGADFSLTENSSTLSNLALAPGRYQPRQRYSISAVDNHPTLGTGATSEANIIVKVNGVSVESDAGNNWIYDAGSRQSVISGSEQLSGNRTLSLTTQLDANNVISYANIYKHANVFVNGFELINTGVDQRYTLTSNTVTILNVQTLPAGLLEQNSNVYVVEHATVDFEDSFFGDVPGALLNIRVTTNDDIAILTGTERIYDITPDMKGDEVILIDIDDSTRFLKKPIGVREYNLWPTTANVSFIGITDSRYNRVPNSGYVNSSNVDFRSFDVPNIANMFSADLFIHPKANNTVHVAISENRDWNVYKFKEANVSVSYIEQEDDDATTYLFTDQSLYSYVDGNLIGGADNNRYLDHHIVLKNAQVSDKFLVWVNEQKVQNQQARISNIVPPEMTEVFVDIIGPASNTVLGISNISPGVSDFSSASATANIDGNGTVLITAETFNMADGDTVTFSSKLGNAVSLHANTFTVSNVQTGTFTVYDSALTANVSAANLYYGYAGKTRIESNTHMLSSGQVIKIVAGLEYSGVYKVEAATANSFLINRKYVPGGPSSGNIMIDAVTITTAELHGLTADYVGKKICLHNTSPKYYTQTYTVGEVTSNTITCYGVFPFADVANVVPANTVVMTTVDHNTVTLNNSDIKVNNVNSVDGICADINRTNEIIRGVITSGNLASGEVNSSSGFSLGMPTLKKARRLTGTVNTQVKGSVPYVLTSNDIDTENLVVLGEITVNPAVEQRKGFNTDSSVTGLTPQPRTTTSISGQTTSSVFNIDAYNQFNALDITLDNISSNGDILCIPKVSPDLTIPKPREETNNNPKVIPDAAGAVNNAGSPVFDHAILSAVDPEVADVGSFLPTQLPPREVYLRPTVHTNTEFVQQQNTLFGNSDSWFYRIYSPGTVTLVFDMGVEFSNISVYQSSVYSTSGGSYLAGTTGIVRTATETEKATLQKGNTGFYEYSNLADPYLPDFQIDNNSNINGCGVVEFTVNPVNGTYIRVEVSESNFNTYRYYVSYPSTVGEINPVQNMSPAQPAYVLPYDGVRPTAELYDDDIPDSPLFSPTGAGGSKKKTLDTTNKERLVYSRYSSFFNDYGGFSVSPMSGSPNVPDIFRKTITVNTVDQVTSYQNLESGIVNSSVQRSGDNVIPLSVLNNTSDVLPPEPLKAIDLYSTPLIDVIQAPMTATYLSYDPIKIDSVNYSVQPTPTVYTSANPETAPVYRPLAGATPSTVPGSPASSGIQISPPTELPKKESPVDVDNFVFTNKPVITVTPKKKQSGNYVAAGAPALAPISKPTPAATIGINDVAAAKDGDVLLINGNPILISGDPVETLNRIRDSKGTGYFTKITTKDNKPAVKVASIDNSPLAFTNGTAADTGYSEVLDWHIVKEHQFYSSTANTVVLSHTDGYTSIIGSLSNIEHDVNITTSSSGDDPNISTSGGFIGTYEAIGTANGNVVFSNVSPTATYTVTNLDGSTRTVTTTVNSGSVIPATTRAYQYGGEGYQVGDRLRVVGGSAAPYGAGRSSFDLLSNRSDAQWNSVPRPAKFIVSAVDSKGSILSLICIDRGSYDQFPSDLDTGYPLEYDYVNSESLRLPPSTSSKYLGSVSGGGTRTGYDFIGSPGSGAGRGVRIRMTATKIRDISSGIALGAGTAVQDMGLQPVANQFSIPAHLADELNSALLAAGYPPEDISFGIAHVNDSIDMLVLDSPVYDGVEFNEQTPGILAKLGLPVGDLNTDRAVITASNATPLNDYNRDLDDISLEPQTGSATNVSFDSPNRTRTSPDGSVTSGSFINLPSTNSRLKIVPSSFESQQSILAPATKSYAGAIPVESIALYSVDAVDTQGPTSLFGNAATVYSSDMFQYELRSLGGSRVISQKSSQNVQVLYLESLRYSTETGLDLPSLSNVWVDNYQGTGWAYLENGLVKRHQTALVDSKYVKNAMIYDSDTGRKEYEYYNWDPFKGILPAVVDAEINYISETDPVVYLNSRTKFGKDNVGQTWWDTSKIRYTWYEQGPSRERWLNWGKAFPGSEIAVYEWVESTVVPLEYVGPGRPKNGNDFIIERRLNPVTLEYTNYYYFWVRNLTTVGEVAANKWKRKFSTVALARYIADPIGQGINTISYITLDSFVMSNLTKNLREDEQNIQINLSRNLNPIGKKHTAWKLVRESDRNSLIPEDLISKMVDSLCEVDAAGNSVPASNLSVVERYGIKFRPRQTMFRYPAEARRVLHYVLNEILADLKLNTLYPGWNRDIPSFNYIETVPWYAIRRVDGVTNQKIRFDDTARALLTVSSVKELNILSQSDLPDGSIIMVKASRNDRYQLWRWCCRANGFSQIAIQDDTIRLSESIYSGQVTTELQSELRALIYALKDQVFTGTDLMNQVFFALMKYAYGEQQQLDWAFKSSYIYVDKQEEDLVQRNGFKPDNFDPIISYLNETKAYSAKIRDYNDGKSPPLEYIKDQAITDFDKPPYADPVTRSVRVLDPNNAADNLILSTDADYIKWYQWLSDQSIPVRTATINLTFDRVDWRLLKNTFNTETTSYSLSIAQNMANINSSNVKLVSNTDMYSMSARIFKYDPEVRAEFDAEIDAYYGAGSSSNTSITHSVSKLQDAVMDGAFTGTLELVKTKVGGGWRGETLDANVFSKVVGGTDPLTLQTVFGFDTTPWDHDSGFGNEWDSYIEVENYEGIFSGNVTFRKQGVTYEGFDGVTFKRLLYGEERPEELVYLSPLENLVMNIRTSPRARDANGNIVAALSVGPFTFNSPAQYDGNGNVITAPANVTYDIYADDGSGNATIIWAQGAQLLAPGEYILVLGGDADVLDNIYAVTGSNTGNNSVTFAVDADSSWTPANINAVSNITVQSIVIGSGTVTSDYVSGVGAVISTDIFSNITVLESDTVYVAGDSNGILDGAYTVSSVDDISGTFVIDNPVFTSSNNTIAGNLIFGKVLQAVPVQYIVHYDLFGRSEYLRQLTNGSTTTRLSANVYAWDDSITVENADILPKPVPGIPGAIWIGNTERVEYRRIDGNTLKDLTRGTRGTVVPAGTGFEYQANVMLGNYDKNIPTNSEQAHLAGSLVISASKSDVFNAPTAQGGSVGFADRDPEYANWLRGTGITRSLADITNRNTITDRTTIAAFLQGELVISVGWDSAPWDTTPWDSL